MYIHTSIKLTYYLMKQFTFSIIPAMTRTWYAPREKPKTTIQAKSQAFMSDIYQIKISGLQVDNSQITIGKRRGLSS